MDCQGGPLETIMPAMAQSSRRSIIVDPVVAHDEEVFGRMMARFESMSDEEHLQFGIEHGCLRSDGSLVLPEGAPCVTPLGPIAYDRRSRVIVDPVVGHEEEVFERMMARFESMTDEEHLQFGVENGYLRPDGSLIFPEGDPCVTRV
jgi:hypothetical protein